MVKFSIMTMIITFYVMIITINIIVRVMELVYWKLTDCICKQNEQTLSSKHKITTIEVEV